MMFKLLFLLLISLSALANADTNQSLLLKVKTLYGKGKYQSAITELEGIELRYLYDKNKDPKTLGLISYWKGLAQKKVQNYSRAIEGFKAAKSYGFDPEDLNYELAQSYYASELLEDAMENFALSYKRNFKAAVSLYYLGYIARELGQLEDASVFLNSVKKSNDPEVREVLQPAEVLLGDVMLEKMKVRKLQNEDVANKIIPQYEAALSVDDSSSLAPLIDEKIMSLQKEHGLFLFKMRNGRPTLRPRYFLRGAQEFGVDSNVTFSPANTTIAEAKQSSMFSRTDFTAKRAFYVRDFVSLTPEVRFTNTYYFNRIPEIYRNDNFLVAPTLRSTFEHMAFSKPAALLLDYEYTESRRDVNAKKKLEFSSRTHGLVLGENFQFLERGETTLKYRHRILESYLSNSDSVTDSFILEQLLKFDAVFGILYASYDRTRVKESSFDTNSLTIRGDLIFPEFKKLFSPNLGLGITATDPINDRSNRGTELLLNPTLKLSRSFTKKLRAHLRFDFQDNKSKDKDNFAFRKYLYALEVDYIF